MSIWWPYALMMSAVRRGGTHFGQGREYVKIDDLAGLGSKHPYGGRTFDLPALLIACTDGRIFGSFIFSKRDRIEAGLAGHTGLLNRRRPRILLRIMVVMYMAGSRRSHVGAGACFRSA